jgi:hypothetical protein
VEIKFSLKKATLMVSKGGESLMITNVLPIYNACTGILAESLEKFNSDDDIYIGIEADLDKLNHYDKISPKVGIALILNPTKKQNYFKAELGWKQIWVDSVILFVTRIFHTFHDSAKTKISC